MLLSISDITLIAISFLGVAVAIGGVFAGAAYLLRIFAGISGIE